MSFPESPYARVRARVASIWADGPDDGTHPDWRPAAPPAPMWFTDGAPLPDPVPSWMTTATRWRRTSDPRRLPGGEW